MKYCIKCKIIFPLNIFFTSWTIHVANTFTTVSPLCHIFLCPVFVLKRICPYDATFNNSVNHSLKRGSPEILIINCCPTIIPKCVGSILRHHLQITKNVEPWAEIKDTSGDVPYTAMNLQPVVLNWMNLISISLNTLVTFSHIFWSNLQPRLTLVYTQMHNVQIEIIT